MNLIDLMLSGRSSGKSQDDRCFQSFQVNQTRGSFQVDHMEIHGQGCRGFLGMGDLPPLMTEILISWGPINPYGLGLMTIPYYMGV